MIGSIYGMAVPDVETAALHFLPGGTRFTLTSDSPFMHQPATDQRFYRTADGDHQLSAGCVRKGDLHRPVRGHDGCVEPGGEHHDGGLVRGGALHLPADLRRGCELDSWSTAGADGPVTVSDPATALSIARSASSETDYVKPGRYTITFTTDGCFWRILVVPATSPFGQ